MPSAVSGADLSGQQPEEKETQSVKVAAHHFARGLHQGEAGDLRAGLSVEPYRGGLQASVGHADDVSVGEGRANRLRYHQRFIGRHPPRGLCPPDTREVLPFHRLENKVRVLAVFPCIVGRRNVRMSP